MQKIELNNTGVTVEVVNGKTVINVNTTDADVIVNGICLWSKFDKPEYEHVPVVLRSFVQEKNSFIEVNDKDKLVVTDLFLENSMNCATLSIPFNKRDAIVARMDFIESMEILEHDYIRNHDNIDNETADSLMNEFNHLLSDIQNSAQEAGYQFVPSHGSNDGIRGWWDIVFSLEKWNEDKFVDIWKKISAFEDRMNQVFDKYKIYS